MKRLFDVFISFFGILLLSPIYIIVSILIFFDSKGGVLYKQIRVGKDQVDFQILKFRTMHVDSDSKGLITVGGRDSRITRIGYFLRKYKLDELPQLFNVLDGSMSLVGPRPEVREYVNLYSNEQLKVLSVKPGITDLASIKFRNENQLLEGKDNPNQYYIDVIMPTKLDYNLEYIKKAGFFYDIKLILITFQSIIID